MSCLSREQIEELALGNMASGERESAMAHVGQCPACARLLAESRDNLDLTCEIQQAFGLPSATEAVAGMRPGSLLDLSFDSGLTLPGPLSETLAGDSIPGYQIVREIHRGAQGIVYQAIQKAARRKVAIKVMREGSFAADRDKARFEREVQTLAALKHPHIVSVHDSGTVGGLSYFVMDYIAGEPLDEYMSARTRSVEETLNLFGRICEAVNAAHLQGIIHRDLKPGNIRVDADGMPHILDFGLAKLAGPQSDAEGRPTFLTITGQFLGSLPWASPEQAQGDPSRIDMRTDVYSLGVILYQMLTGRFPYEVVGNMRDVLDNIMRTEPVSPRSVRRQIGSEVETLVMRCLAKERERRFQSAGELGREIRRYLAGEPIESKRDSVFYVLRKTLRLHGAAVAVCAGFLVLLVAGFATTTTLWRQAEAARAVALVQHQRAIERTHEADRQRGEATRQAYRAAISAADAALSAGETAAAMEQLDHAPADLRGWEWRHLHHRASLSDLVLHGYLRTNAVAFDPRGVRVAAAHQDGSVRIWDVRTGRPVVFLPLHAGGVWSVKFNPSGSGMAVGDCDGTISLWTFASHPGGSSSIAMPSLVARWKGHDYTVRDLAYDAEGSHLASVSNDGTAKVWEVASGRLLHTLVGHRGPVGAIVFSPLGQTVASAGVDGSVRIWDVATGQQCALLQHSAPLEALDFSPTGRRLVAASQDSTLRRWDVATRRELPALIGHTGAVTAVAFSPNGSRIISGAGDNTVRLWNASTGDPLIALPGYEAGGRGVAFASDGTRIACGQGAAVRVRDRSGIDEPLILGGHEDRVNAIAWHPDGDLLASAGWDGVVRLWEAVSGRQLVQLQPRSLRGHPNRMFCVGFSRDGSYLAAGGGDSHRHGLIEIWDVSTSRPIAVLTGHKADVSSVAFTSDGRRLVAGAYDGTIGIWHFRSEGSRGVAAGRSVALPADHQKAVVCVSINPAGPQFASGCADGAIQLRDLGTGRVLSSVTSPGVRLRSVSFSPDGRFLVAGYHDGAVRVWDMNSPRTQPTASGAAWPLECTPLSGHTAAVNSVAFDPTGERLVSASNDGTLKVWDARSWGDLLTLRGGAGPVLSARFSPDGLRLASAGPGNAAQIWDTIDRVTLIDRRKAAFETAKAGQTLVENLFARLDDPQAVVEHLEEDASLNEPVRKAALRAAMVRSAAWYEQLQHLAQDTLERCPPRQEMAEFLEGRSDLSSARRQALLELLEGQDRAYRLCAAAWAIVRSPDSDLDSVRNALAWAGEATESSPETGWFLSVRGIAEYRTGAWRKALNTLGFACELMEDTPDNLAFICMAEHRLQDDSRAQESLRRLNRLMDNTDWSHDDIAQSFFREAVAELGRRSGGS